MTEHPDAVIAVLGNPNAGKTTLFNSLTGLRQKTANFPGVTVEWHQGQARIGSRELTLIDLPGTYTLSARSPDEEVAIDTLLGRVPELGRPQAVLLVLDATKLYQSLYLATQVREMELPCVVALTKSDIAARDGVVIDAQALSAELRAPVIPVVGTRGEGVDAIRAALAAIGSDRQAAFPVVYPALYEASQALAEDITRRGEPLSRIEAERAMLEVDGQIERRLCRRLPDFAANALSQARRSLAGERPLIAVEARIRYQYIRRVLERVESRRDAQPDWRSRLEEILNQPVVATITFLVVMATVFQAVFAWATPLVDGIDAMAGWLAEATYAHLPDGALTSLLADGVIAGVGSVVVFLPQILILFTFIIVLEDTGYLARAAFLMDRFMRGAGLSGQSVIPMISSFACAVPGIMATRVIGNPRDRLATIMSAPFMTCSARLPVYSLLIGAFIPAQTYLGGWVNLQGLVLFGLYLLGIVGGVVTAFLLRRLALRGAASEFMMELPPFLLPNLKGVLIRLMDRARVFMRRAGTVIFTVAVVVWALVYFPHSAELEQRFDAQRAQVQASIADPDARAERLAELDREEGAAALRYSALGRMGSVVEPVFRPLGWDWRVSAGVIASFPAREVVIAVLSTIYAVADDGNEGALIDRLKASTWPDGRKVFNLPMALGLMVFYAFCLQCVATIAIMRRETNSWRWPVAAWTYMTGLGYGMAWLTVKGATALGLGA